MPKFVFVTGGVVSSIGKGIVAASLGRLLKSRGYNVSILKLDPYLNVDPGTMSPFQHGEVFVTEDGAETDLDLGHYERFTDTAMSRLNSVGKTSASRRKTKMAMRQSRVSWQILSWGNVAGLQSDSVKWSTALVLHPAALCSRTVSRRERVT